MKLNRQNIPLYIDFSRYGNGVLPYPFVGPTWSVSSGKLVNTPTLGANKLTDGDMETAGVASWGAYNTPTTRAKNAVNPLSGLQDLHIITDAAPEGANQNFAPQLPVGWYSFTGEYRVVNGRATITGGVGSFTHYAAYNVADATKTTGRCAFLNLSAVFYSVWLTAQSAGEFYFDNVEIKAISGLRTLYNSRWIDPLVVSADCTMGGSVLTGQAIGVSANWDASQQNGIDCYIDRVSGVAKIIITKTLSGVPQAAVLSQNITYVDGAPVALKKSGTTYQAWYNGAQIGTDVTISDAAIISNTNHGLFSTGGASSHDAFFCGAG